MSPSMPYEVKDVLVSVENVSLTLGGKQILRDVNFEIRDITRPGIVTGQVVALLGPSGMGKTRLFRIIAGLDQPDSGAVRIGTERKLVERGKVGVVFQNYPLFDHRTVMSNLVLAAKRGGCKGVVAIDKARASLERFGMSEHGKKYPAELSGGQRQRVAIAQQFLCSQHYLLMDEPFSGLDPIAEDRVCEVVNEVAGMDEFNTIVVVTHNIEAAVEIADTVLLLGRDREANGTPIPGARIQASYNLIEMGLTWRKGVDSTPEFMGAVREIRGRFREL